MQHLKGSFRVRSTISFPRSAKLRAAQEKDGMAVETKIIISRATYVPQSYGIDYLPWATTYHARFQKHCTWSLDVKNTSIVWVCISAFHVFFCTHQLRNNCVQKFKSKLPSMRFEHTLLQCQKMKEKKVPGWNRFECGSVHEQEQIPKGPSFCTNSWEELGGGLGGLTFLKKLLEDAKMVLEISRNMMLAKNFPMKRTQQQRRAFGKTHKLQAVRRQTS